MLEENKKYNLTGVRERNEAWNRHILDSLTLLEPIEQHHKHEAGDVVTLLDVGSGGGLPGCVLAIARPHWQVRTCRLRQLYPPS